MRVLKNIMITMGLFALSVLVGGLINASNPPTPGSGGAIPGVAWLMVIGTALWAAVSAKRLEFRKYRSGLASGPTAVFLVNVLLWAVAFPWFLTIRDNIKDGSAELKDEFKLQPQVFREGPRRDPIQAPPLPPAFTPRQTEGFGSRPPVPPPVPARAMQPPVDRLDQLQRLADMKNHGILTEEEFQAEKRKVLG